jgi:hypothetical protein
VAKSMIRTVIVPERPTFLEPEGIGSRNGEKGAEQETMDFQEFIARVTSHFPDKNQVMIRKYGLCANVRPGKARNL